METLPRFLFFKGLHLFEYALLALFLYLGLRDKYKVLFFGYLYALSDEIHQSLIVGRSGRFWDTLIDFLGLTLGLLLAIHLQKKSPFFKKFFK